MFVEKKKETTKKNQTEHILLNLGNATIKTFSIIFLKTQKLENIVNLKMQNNDFFFCVVTFF